MHFEPEAYPAEALPLFRRFLGIAPWPIWEKRFNTFKAWKKTNPLILEFIVERYLLEVQMMMIRDRYQKEGVLPSPTEDAVAYQFFSFVSMVARVHQRLSPTGQNILEGQIRGRLRENVGLSSLAFEIAVAGRLMGAGFDVTFHDFENDGGFDFLCERDSAILEVECKHVSGDVGRQIHGRRLIDFGGAIHRDLAAAIDRKATGILLRLILPGRLTGAEAETKALADQVKFCLASGSGLPGPTPSSIEVIEFDFRGSPFDALPESGIDQDAVRKFIEEKFGLVNSNVVTVFQPGRGAAVVAVESRKTDHVVRGIIRQLKDASRDQLTGTFPGMLCIHLADLTHDQLLALARRQADDPSGVSGIELGTSHLLQRRPHVHTVAYSTFGQIVRRQVQTDAAVYTSQQEQGFAYEFQNPEHPQHGDPRYQVF